MLNLWKGEDDDNCRHPSFKKKGGNLGGGRERGRREWSKRARAEGDFVRFNDKYRLRKKEERGREGSGYAAAKTRHQTREKEN